MGDYDNLYNAGNKILTEVTKAVETGNYDNLSVSLKVSIEDAVRTAKANTSQNFRGRASTVRTVHYASGGRARITPFFTRMIGLNRGSGKIIGGITGAAIFGIGALGSGSLSGFLVCALFALPFALLIKKGQDEKKLAKAFNKYGRILGNAEYFAVSDLAMAAGERSDNVLKNLKKMMDKDFLPTARFDRTESTMMLSERAFAQYMRAEKARQDRERAQAQNMANQQRFQAESTANVADNKVRAIINEGNAYLETIRKINDAIPGDEMSEKLYQLENIMRKIFKQVEKEPECADELKKFMNYYLPTTTKLLNAYVDLDKQPEVGDNIIKTKKEIEDAVDVINDAFESLLDSLFEDMAWDISSDISVMKTMMAQDGLTTDALFSAPTPEPVPVERGNYQPTPSPMPLTFDGAAYQAAPSLQAGAQEQEAQDGKVELKF